MKSLSDYWKHSLTPNNTIHQDQPPLTLCHLLGNFLHQNQLPLIWCHLYSGCPASGGLLKDSKKNPQKNSVLLWPPGGYSVSW